MPPLYQDKLERLGLSATESHIYLILLRNCRAMGASSIASATEMARSSIYPALNRLTDLGLVEAEAGYGSGFSAVPPNRALPSLIMRETEELSDRKRLARELVGQLESLAEPRETEGDAELIQVLRDPRVIAERFERLQLEAQVSVEAFVKAPIFNGPSGPTQEKGIRRGVHYRGLYERKILEAPEIEPFLEQWLASGEEARVHEGDLPHKLALFDRETVLLPLLKPGRQGKTLVIRHAELAASLGILFDFFWSRAEPLGLVVKNTGAAKARERSAKRNGAGRKRSPASEDRGVVANPKSV